MRGGCWPVADLRDPVAFVEAYLGRPLTGAERELVRAYASGDRVLTVRPQRHGKRELLRALEVLSGHLLGHVGSPVPRAENGDSD